MKAAKHPGRFLARTDIRKLLGISRQYVSRVVKREDFPAPECVVMEGEKSQQPIWSRADIERWAEKHSNGAG